MIGRRGVLKGAALMSMPQRPDQRYDPPSPAVGPGGRSGILRARLVIISGTGIVGWFEYNGAPKLGNPPVAYAAPPGVTKDPYGNSLPFSTGGVSVAQYSGSVFQAGIQVAGNSIVFGDSALASAANLTLDISTFGASTPALSITANPYIIVHDPSNNAHAVITVLPSGDTSGATDRTNINAAIALLATGIGGRCVLITGTYYIDTSVIIDGNQIILEGQGTSATTIARPSTISSPQTATVVVGNTKTLSQSGVKNLGVNNSAGTGAPITNSGHGIAFAVNQGVLENVLVQYAEKDGFHIGQDQVAFTSGTTTIAAGSDGNALPQATINVASTAGLTSSGNVIIEASTGPAYISYTGTAGGNQLTGCTASFTSGAVLHTGQSVSQVGGLFDLVAVNCYAQFCGTNGWYIDWTYGSCEFVACKANAGATSSKPVATGSVLGWLIYGTQIKLVVCHAFFASGYGLQLNGPNQFTGGLLTVVGGEMESCATGGMNIVDPSGACYINGVQFYNNGIATGQSDLVLAFSTKQVNIQSCTFRHAASGAVQIAQNIYGQHVSYVRITDCEFDYQFVPRAIEIDGSGGAANACDHVFIRNNRCNGAFASTVFVRLNDRVTFCDVSGNITDATIQEFGANPNNNRVYENVLVAGFSATVTLVGTSSQEWNNSGLATTNSLGGTHMYSVSDGNTLTPAVAVGAQAASVSISAPSTDIAGQVSAVEVAVPGAGSVIAVSYFTPFTNTPLPQITPANANAAIAQGYISAVSNTGFTISQHVAPAGGVTVAWNYAVFGQDG